MVSIYTRNYTLDGKACTLTRVTTMVYSKAATADEVKTMLAPVTTDMGELGLRLADVKTPEMMDKFNAIFKKYL